MDESRLVGRFMLFGSLWIDRALQEDFNDGYWKIWDKHFPSRNSELKWTKVSRSKLDAYKEFIEYFAKFTGVDFRALVLDHHSVDYQKYHNGDKDLGFYKFLYFFLTRNIGKDYAFRNQRQNHQVFLDPRPLTFEFGRLLDLKVHLNSDLQSRCPEIDHPVVRNVEAVSDSKDSPEVQILDVLLGAVGYAWEGYETSETKLSLIQYIEELFGMDLRKNTPYLSEKINIWNFKLSK